MNSNEQITILLKEAAQNAKHWISVASYLEKHLKRTNDPLLAFVYAFSYVFAPSTNEKNRKRPGPFIPFIESGDGKSFPPPLHALPDEMIEAWARVYEATLPPIVASRLADLLWIRKYGEQPYIYAHNAIEHYLAVCNHTTWDSQLCIRGLMRALDLSLEIRNKEMTSQVIQKIISIAQVSLEKGLCTIFCVKCRKGCRSGHKIEPPGTGTNPIHRR